VSRYCSISRYDVALIEGARNGSSECRVFYSARVEKKLASIGINCSIEIVHAKLVEKIYIVLAN
jgi:hypothetical protein